jgi:hypothetical protein
LLALHLKPIEHWMSTPLRQRASTARGPLLSPSDLRIGFGGACLMVIAYPIIRLSGHSKLFNIPALCATFVVFAGAFLFSTLKSWGPPTADPAADPK